MDLKCEQCGQSFVKPAIKGPVPRFCSACARHRRSQRSVARYRAQLATLDEIRCARCRIVKSAEDFAPSQRFVGSYCRPCQRERYVERRGGREGRTCQACGTKFEVVVGSRQLYCTRGCKQRASQDRKTERRRRAKPKRKCAGCDGGIPAEKKSEARYCSDACRREHAGPAIRRRSMLKRTYGLTPEQYDALVQQQNGRCAICATEEPGSKGVWHVDHCHENGAVRGLLCTNCNTGLGQFKDDPKRLAAAIEYLATR